MNREQPPASEGRERISLGYRVAAVVGASALNRTFVAGLIETRGPVTSLAILAGTKVVPPAELPSRKSIDWMHDSQIDSGRRDKFNSAVLLQLLAAEEQKEIPKLNGEERGYVAKVIAETAAMSQRLLKVNEKLHIEPTKRVLGLGSYDHARRCLRISIKHPHSPLD